MNRQQRQEAEATGIDYNPVEVKSIVQDAVAHPECLTEWELTFCTSLHRKLTTYKKVTITEKQIDIIYRIARSVNSDAQLITEQQIAIVKNAAQHPGLITDREYEFVSGIAAKDLSRYKMTLKPRNWLNSIHEKLCLLTAPRR